MTSSPVKGRWLTPTFIGIILVLIGLATAVYGIGILLLIIGVLLIIADQRRLKCPNCRTRGRLAPIRSELLKEQRGFGLVTRADRIQTQRGRQQENTVIRRQERVPMIRRTVRTFYKCGACSAESWVDRTTEAEDFSPPQPEIRTVIERQVVKIPCKYCRNLISPDENRCSYCGGKLG